MMRPCRGGGVREEWEGEASDHLGVKLSFGLAACHPTTPKKKRIRIVGAAMEQTSPVKKRKCAARGQAAEACPEKATADADAWLHRLDSELSKRQSSAVQLHCVAEGSSQKRALVVSGAYSLRAVGFALAEAFGKAADDFDPHPNKGKTPPGLLFSRQTGEKWHTLMATLKIVQAVQEPGDSIRVDMEGLRLSVTLDAIKFKGDPGYDLIKNRPMPRCVGADRGLTQNILKRFFLYIQALKPHIPP